MIFKPNIINASIITQTKPELYVTQLLPRKYNEVGVTFTPALLEAELKTVREITSLSENGTVLEASLINATLRSVKQIQNVKEQSLQLSTDILGSTLVTIRNTFNIQNESIQSQPEFLSAELNANFNRGYSLESTDSVVLGAVVTGITLLQRT